MDNNFYSILRKSVLALPVFLLISVILSAQSTYIPQGNAAYPYLERMEIRSGNLSNQVFLDVQPVRRDLASNFVNSLDSNTRQSKVDLYWKGYFRSDNLPFSGSDIHDSMKPFLKYFYRSKANYFQVNDTGIELYINPVFGFSKGNDQDDNYKIQRNTRGLELRGIIDKKLSFYSYLTDNQVFYPKYVRDFILDRNVVPGVTLWKRKTSTNPANFGTDYLSARGYINFAATKHINLQFGNDRNFIGSGYRSLLLSDYAPNYLFLKVSTQVWRIHYQNLFTQFTDYIPHQPEPYNKKYGAFHYLSTDITRWWNFGIFESVIFYDVKKEGRAFDLNYLNPIIFYRAVEHSMGSADNSLLGGNTSLIVRKRVKLYGQLLFDELRIAELRSRNNWWGNKYAYQAGFKYVDVLGIKNVDWQCELNAVRPYTYSEDSTAKTYSSFKQALAHPAGANFREIVNILRINPYGPLNITLKLIYLQQGKDTGSMDYGSNILNSYALRNKEYGVLLLQGVKTTTVLAEAKISYMLFHNLFLDLDVAMRTEKNALTGKYAVDKKLMYIGGGLRFNFISQNLEF